MVIHSSIEWLCSSCMFLLFWIWTEQPDIVQDSDPTKSHSYVQRIQQVQQFKGDDWLWSRDAHSLAQLRLFEETCKDVFLPSRECSVHWKATEGSWLAMQNWWLSRGGLLKVRDVGSTSWSTWGHFKRFVWKKNCERKIIWFSLCWIFEWLCKALQLGKRKGQWRSWERNPLPIRRSDVVCCLKDSRSHCLVCGTTFPPSAIDQGFVQIDSKTWAT